MGIKRLFRCKKNEKSLIIMQNGKTNKKNLKLLFNQIHVSNGRIVKIIDLTSSESGLKTCSDDPQIWIDFPTKIKTLYIEIVYTSDNETHSLGELDIYYSYEKNPTYSESQKLSLKIFDNEPIKRMIFFDEGIKSIRLDPININDFAHINSILIKGIEKNSDSLNCGIEGILPQTNIDKKVLIFTHALDESGAPILAYNIAQKFQQRGYEVVVLSREKGNGFLEEKYSKLGIPVIYMFYDGDPRYPMWISEKCTDEELKNVHCRYILGYLKKYGFRKVVTNTIVTGEYVRLLKCYGFEIISLIHEMKKTIQLYNFNDFGKQISLYSDYVIFPDEMVKEDFTDIFEKIWGQVMIKSQGVYLKYDDSVSCKDDLYKEFGIPRNSTIVLCSGTAILRKGVDLFICAAQNLLESEESENYHFIWIGNFDKNNELGGWLILQIERFGLKERFHFIPFLRDVNRYKKLLQMADVFWSTSREDPFPSVVLEAMLEKVPVLAFKNSGGVNTLLDQGRGILISNFNVGNLALQTKALLKDDIKRNKMICKAKKYVEESQDFADYIDKLDELLAETDKSKVLIVLPDLEIGGGQIAGINLANKLSEKFNVYIWIARKQLLDKNVRGMINENIIVCLGGEDSEKLRRWYCQMEFENVISMIWWSDKLVYQALKDEKVNWVLSMHGCYEYLIEHPEVDPFFRENVKSMLLRANKISYVADKNLTILNREKLDIFDKVCYIPNGVGIGMLPQKSRDSLGMTEDAFVFGLTSRGIAEKGWEIAIQAIKCLRDKGYNNAHLLLIGSSEYEIRLKERESHEYIHFIDKFDRPLEWLAYDRLCDVGILPTYFKSESLPMSIIEYMLLEKPIIATDIGNIKSMIHKGDYISGISLELKDGKPTVDDLVDAMEKMIVDKIFYQTCKESTKELMKEFTIDKCAEKYECLLINSDEEI